MASKANFEATTAATSSMALPLEIPSLVPPAPPTLITSSDSDMPLSQTIPATLQRKFERYEHATANIKARML